MSRIAAIEAVVVNVSPKTNWTFLAVTTDAGVTGWGECSLNRWEPLLTAYTEIIARDLVGCEFVVATDGIRYLPHSPGGLVAHAVRSALQQAITDVAAQLAERPIHRLLGSLSKNIGARVRQHQSRREVALARGFRQRREGRDRRRIQECQACALRWRCRRRRRVDADRRAHSRRHRPDLRCSRRDWPSPSSAHRLPLAIRRGSREGADRRRRGRFTVLDRVSRLRAHVPVRSDRALAPMRTGARDAARRRRNDQRRGSGRRDVRIIALRRAHARRQVRRRISRNAGDCEHLRGPWRGIFAA